MCVYLRHVQFDSQNVQVHALNAYLYLLRIHCYFGFLQNIFRSETDDGLITDIKINTESRAVRGLTEIKI